MFGLALLSHLYSMIVIIMCVPVLALFLIVQLHASKYPPLLTSMNFLLRIRSTERRPDAEYIRYETLHLFCVDKRVVDDERAMTLPSLTIQRGL